MGEIQPLSRRNIVKISAISLAGLLLRVPVVAAKQEATPERDPLAAGIEPSTASTSESFREARGFDITLNTQVQSEVEVQNRFDTAVLEMFNVMKANEILLNNGELTSFIENGNIPEGRDLEEFSKQLQESDELPITVMYYPDGAQSSTDGQWGEFDAKKGLKLNFIEEDGLFVVSMLSASNTQVYGLTPRLTEDEDSGLPGLQLDIHMINSAPRDDHPNPENYQDIVHTWFASNMMQVMMLSHGNADAYINRLGNLNDKLFNTPAGVFETVASIMSSKPIGSDNHFVHSIRNPTCLLDLQPIDT